MGMSCDCSIYDDDYSVAEFYNKSYPKARKEHTCCECRDKIVVNSIYEKITGKWDGKISTFKTCMPCVAIRNHYCPNGVVFENLRTQIKDCLGFDYTEVPEEDD